MTISSFRIAAAAVAIGAPAAVFAQSVISGLGVQGSVFFPSGNEIRNAFGKQFASAGISFGDRATPGHNKITTDFGLIGANKNGQRFLLIPFTIGYESVLAEQNQSTLPYYRIGVGVAYYDYSINRGANNFATRKLAPTGVAELGVLLEQRLRISGKYNVFANSDGFNFNGFSLSATYTLVKF